MLVVIPTYRRLDTVPWVIRSLFQAERPELGSQRMAVLIVNNYPPGAAALEEAVRSVRLRTPESLKWDVEILHRPQTLPPVESWYGAIFANALDGETVLLCGDDDLFTGWSLRQRFAAQAGSDADLLLCKAQGGLYYVSATQARFSGQLPSRVDAAPGVGEVPDLMPYQPAFIGNHCYKAGPRIRDAFERLHERVAGWDWLSYDERTLMFPMILPYQVRLSGGRVSAIDSVCMLRGVSLSELIDSPFGLPSWNNGFLAWIALAQLSVEEFDEVAGIAAIRGNLWDFSRDLAPTYRWDRRISHTSLRGMQQKKPLRLSFSNRLAGARRLLGQALGVRGLRMRLGLGSDLLDIEDLLRRIR